MNLIGRIRGINPQRIGVVLLALAGCLPALLMWHWVSRNWVPIPTWDEWHTPGSQFASWCRGNLTISELFSLHNESRKFFPRLLYFTLAAFGGWDVRKEMRVVFVLVCTLSVLLLFLLRRTSGATRASTCLTWALMVALCFAPVQVENFLYGIQGEAFFVGTAVVAAAALNLSRVLFRTKVLGNAILAFTATYTFANGMLVWALAWPLAAVNESTTLRNRVRWYVAYAVVGVISIGCYFIGYHRPSYHPELASVIVSFGELSHYLVLWVGRCFASDFGDPLILGIIVLLLFAGAVGFAFRAIRRRGDWRTFYPWLLIGAYACATGAITVVGRLGFGVQQALDTRYVAFSLFFYIALFGLYFAIYCSCVRSGSPSLRTSFLTSAAWMIALFALLWVASYKKNLRMLAETHKYQLHLLHTLEWIDPIPDNPDLALIFPDPGMLKEDVTLLEKRGILRLPLVHGSLASAVQQSPPRSDGSHGQIETCRLDSDGTLHVIGWAWLPERNRRADCVVIGSENAKGVFTTITVLETGVVRRDLYEAKHDPHIFRAGFAATVKMADFLEPVLRLKGWAIDWRGQKAWPLTSSAYLEEAHQVRDNIRIASTNASPAITSEGGNISTRAFVQTGDKVMIGGFVVQGPDAKSLIVRAIGPELTQYGVSNVLADPTLELRDGSGALIASNGNWQSTTIGGLIPVDQVSDIRKSGHAPNSINECAIMATFPPGKYTAVVRGANNTTGIALVEVYDLSPGDTSNLGNISTRGFVQAGDNVMIGGFLVKGTAPKKVIVRAVGPELNQYGLPNPLLDPKLELYNGAGTLIASNNDWQTTIRGGLITTDQVQSIMNTGMAPGDPRESAIVAELAPGNYTAIVRGVNTTAGVALVEVYDLHSY